MFAGTDSRPVGFLGIADVVDTVTLSCVHDARIVAGMANWQRADADGPTNSVLGAYSADHRLTANLSPPLG